MVVTAAEAEAARPSVAVEAAAVDPAEGAAAAVAPVVAVVVADT